MKVLHVVEPFSSGIITFVISLTESLPEHQHVVMHGCRVTEDKMESVRGRFPDYVRFKIWRYADRSLNPLLDLKAFIFLLRHLKKEKYDIIHLHSAKAGFLGRIAGFLLRKKNIIYTPNGAPFLRQDVGAFKRVFFKKLEQFGAFLNGRVICCGKSESETYHQAGVKNIYINNGVKIINEANYDPSNKIQIVSAGILTFQKNPMLFNRIASQFLNDPRIEFIWIGYGELINQIDLNFIKVTGWISSEKVQEYINKSDIYLSTSLWEGQPFAVIEAMNNGKALVLSNCVGNIDLVESGRNGYIFNNIDEAVEIIRHLLENKSLIKKFGQMSRKKCMISHDQMKMGELYENEYHKYK